MFVFSEGNFNIFTVLIKMSFSVRTMFQSDRVLNSLNMVNGYFKDAITILNLMFKEQIWLDCKYKL